MLDGISIDLASITRTHSSNPRRIDGLNAQVL